MVATRGQGRKQAPREEQEPERCAYQKKRDAQVARNLKKFQELRLHELPSGLNITFPQPEPTKGKKSSTNNKHSEDSDTSEYLVEQDVQGDSDDDDSESDSVEQPIALAVQYPRDRGKGNIVKRKNNQNMAPGGRQSKRVRAEVEAARASERLAKRTQTQGREGLNEEEPRTANDEIPQGSYTAPSEDNVVADQDNTNRFEQDGVEDNVAGEDVTEGSAQRAPRRPRPPTKGTLLTRMTKAMGRRLPINIAEGNKRPHEPVQAAKLASEAGVIVRDKYPIHTHWKEYKKDVLLYKKFTGKLAVRLAINDQDTPTEEAILDVLKNLQRQVRHRLKKTYFDGVPANEIRTTSPVSSMNDEQWRALVVHWSDPKNMETSAKNKQNRSKVKYHQATGSRSYVAHLHALKEKMNMAEPSTGLDEEIDAVEAFTACHTSSKHGLSGLAREAVSNMEALRAEPVAEGEAPVSSVQVLTKVLPEKSSQHFLKNLGIKPVATKKSSSSVENELREQLAAAQEKSGNQQAELEALKKKSEEAEEKLANTQKEMQEYKQLVEENNALMKRFFEMRGGGPST